MILHVRDLMRTDIVHFSSDEGIDVLEQELLHHHISGAPVIDEGKLVGVVTHTDIVRQLALEQTYSGMTYDYYETPSFTLPDGVTPRLIDQAVEQRTKHLKIGDIMSTAIISVQPYYTLEEAAELMMWKKIHRLLVVNDGELLGVLSSTDFVRLYTKEYIGSHSVIKRAI